MKSAIFLGKDSISVEDVELPHIKDGELLIKIKAVGVCPTDVKAFYFGSSSIKTPRILGHEVAGIVQNSRTDLFNPGDRINVAADNPCMKCDRCLRGLHNLCRNITSLGVNVDGGYAEYLRVPKEFVENHMVAKLTDNISFIEGTFIEPVAVSLNALSLTQPKNSDTAVIIGDGPNAMIHLQLLKKFYGIKKVLVMGMLPHRLKLARDLGATDAIDISSEPDYATHLGHDFDIIDITIGNGKALEQAMTLADAGTRIAVFGGSIKDSPIPITMNGVHYNQITVTGSTGTSAPNYFEAVKIVNTGILDLKTLISKTFSLEDIVESFGYSKDMRGIKGAITF